LEENTRVSINVGPGVLGLTVLGQDVGDDVVQLAGELEHGVGGEVLEGELTLASVTGVGLSQDSVTVTRNDLARLEGLPDVVLDLLVGGVRADFGTEFEGPAEDFLVGKTVEGTSKTVETGSEGQVRVRESTADKVGSVSTVTINAQKS
jgi:hypothetical protein